MGDNRHGTKQLITVNYGASFRTFALREVKTLQFPVLLVSDRPLIKTLTNVSEYSSAIY
jgi:hypothetical protein